MVYLQMKGSVIVTSAIWVGILYLVTATAVATHSDSDNVINILALTGATCVLLVHLMAAGGCFIEKSDENDLGRWPKWLHGLAHAPALLFVLFGPWGSGVAIGVRFVVQLLGFAMTCEHATGGGVYGREAQADGTGVYSCL